MINYQKAIKIINKVSLNLPNEKISISDSLNRVCAKNILSPSTNPLANNTAFDGFAVLAKETKGLSKKKVKKFKILKISNKKNENVTASILIWGTIFLIPITAFTEKPWNLNPSIDSTISLIYLGVVATGLAWLLRFRILKNNGLVFQAQVAYLIPIFGIILGYIFLNELITPKVVVAVVAVIIGIYLVKKSNKIKII